MPVVEIRCPRCGSSSSIIDEKKHEYKCNHCGTTFVFVDTTKREVTHETRAHNCPMCGRPVKAGEGFTCKECKTEYLCENCIQITREHGFDKVVCKKCLEQMGLTCSEYGCKNEYEHSCVVCGKKYCKEHSAVMFNTVPSIEEMKRQVKETVKTGYSKYPAVFSLYCEQCGGYVCRHCYAPRSSFWGGKEDYYCKKCGSKLEEFEKLAEY